MKKIFTFFLLLLFTSALMAQAPQAIKYQAVARNLNGDPVINQDIAVKISILSGSETGPVVYSELHEIPTNQMGLFTLEIGNATFVLSGNFSEIGWGYNSHFLKTEIDITGSSNYQLMGVSQLVSVPYALYANEAGNAENYVAGTGINVSNGVITNTAPDKTVTIASGTGISATGTYPNFMVTNTNPDQNVTLTSGYGITNSGTYPNFTITNAKPNATHTGDATGDMELTVTGLQGRPVFNIPPSAGQVLKWTGTRWSPSTLDPYTAGAGIDITNNVVTNTSPDQNVTIGSGTGISATGTYPNFMLANTAPNATHTGDATGGSILTVEKIRGRTVSASAPTSNQVLQWSGSQWAPTTLASPSEDWKLTGNSGTSPTTNFIGTTDNAALQFKVSNAKAGWIEQWYGSNTCFGYESLRDVTSGQFNTALGNMALRQNTEGKYNTALGDQSLESNTIGKYNTSCGYVAMVSNTTGENNSSFGWASLYDNTSGSSNTAIGSRTLANNTTGFSNVAIGSSALYHNTTQSQIVAIGDSALYHNGFSATNSSAGTSNTAIGSKALRSNTIGLANTALGFKALYSNIDGDYNTSIGNKALYYNEEGYCNSAVGSHALFNNNTGDYNSAFGVEAQRLNSTGNCNTAVGAKALYTNITADSCTAIGAFALYNNNGFVNTATGMNALYANTSGFANTAAGKDALHDNTTGDFNTATGCLALTNASAGNQNTSVGANSLTVTTTGSYNTAVGYNTGPGGTNYVNTTCLGIDASATGSNMVRIGNAFVNSIGGYQNWTNISDSRVKENVSEDVPGLSFITQLRPVTFQINREKINEFSGLNDRRNKIKEKNPDTEFLEGEKYSQVTTGFLAQEVEAAAKSIGFEFSGVDAPKNENDMYGLRYAEFVVPLVKAVQEQQKMIAEMQKKNEDLQNQIDDLKAILKK